MTALFILLILIALPLWAWLVVRIWPVSAPAARASFCFVVPAYFWAYYHLNDRDLNLRPLITANLLVGLLVVASGYKVFETGVDTLLFGAEYAQQKQRAKSPGKSDAHWERWCREQNDATYDPLLRTCVENDKSEAIARSRAAGLIEKLARHLNDQPGIKGEFDESLAAGAVEPALLTPEVARATPWYFVPMSMAQPPVAVLLCISEDACRKYARAAAERGVGQIDRNANLLLVTPADDADERIASLRLAFSRFSAK